MILLSGITGLFSSSNINFINERIEKMTAEIYHRGPDAGRTFVINNNLALGYRRLKTIDLSEDANQPMISNSGRYIIVFDGVIYNFREIKSLLTYEFNSDSDTEVILGAVEEKGLDWFLNKANGMFAIALYDKEENSITLIRDRFGIKPLYYTLRNNILIFASEIKSILKSGLFEPEFNQEVIDIYLGYRYTLEPYTFFKDIYQVESSNYIKFFINKRNSIVYQKKAYWSLPELNFDNTYSEDDILDELEKKLIEAIKRCLIADVRPGTYLSGGLDSSLITAITANLTNKRINTYTIGFLEDGFNEFEFSRKVAKKYQTKHHEILVDIEDYLNRWKELIYFKDAPLGVPNEIPLAIMTSELKKEVSVVLSGEGADELFGGYGRIFRTPFYYRNKYVGELTPYQFFISNYEYVPRNMRDMYLLESKELRKKIDIQNSVMFNDNSFEEAIFRFFHQVHIKGLLQRVDMTTMQASVEARVPFLDHELIEFVYKRIPYDLKLKWKDRESLLRAQNMTPEEFSEVLDIPKYILKQIAYKYLPAEIIERRKVGFPVPLNKWFNNISYLANDILKTAYWLKNKELDELIEQAENSQRAGQILWMFINVELFRRRYFDNKWSW